jgi:hypothetical protein
MFHGLGENSIKIYITTKEKLKKLKKKDFDEALNNDERYGSGYCGIRNFI